MVRIRIRVPKNFRAWVIGVAALAVLFSIPSSVWGQLEEIAGQAEIAVQSYHFSGGGQPVSNMTGFTAKFREFLPSVGFLEGTAEGSAGNQGWQTGENHIDLKGAVWKSYRWFVSGGDFRVSTAPQGNPFVNLYYPEIGVRGISVESGRGPWNYRFYYGAETLAAGPRISYRIKAPQNILGGEIRYEPTPNFSLSFRQWKLSNQFDQPSQDVLFLNSDRLSGALNSSVQATYKWGQNVKLFAETTLDHATDLKTGKGEFSPSFVAGAAWSSPRVTARFNYLDQSVLYMPVPGFSAGNRRGPFAELRVQVRPGVELFSSASNYENRIIPGTKAPHFSSDSVTGGVSAELPFGFNANAQYSRLDFATASLLGSTQKYKNTILSASVGRRVGQHQLRYTYRQMYLYNNELDVHYSSEIEDAMHLRNLTLSTAVRVQNRSNLEDRTSIYGRMNAQLNLGPISAYGFYEAGSDLVNRTLLATSATRTTVAGVSARLPDHWEIRGEAIRTKLTNEINPESVFVLQNNGGVIPGSLAGLNQWSMYVRVSKQFNWGGQMPGGGMEQFVRNPIPITGSVEGFVMARSSKGDYPVPGVPVVYEGGRKALTDQTGRYRLLDIPEGLHRIGLSREELSAEFDPEVSEPVTVLVKPGAHARLDFGVFPLSSFCGSIQAPEPISPENIIFKLNPGGKYTTPDQDGEFCFDNLREGGYVVTVDPESLPNEAHLSGADAHAIQVPVPQGQPKVQFSIEETTNVNPTRKVLDKSVSVAEVLQQIPTTTVSRPALARAASPTSTPRGYTRQHEVQTGLGNRAVATPGVAGATKAVRTGNPSRRVSKEAGGTRKAAGRSSGAVRSRGTRGSSR